MDKDPDQMLKDAMDELDKGHYKEAETLVKTFCNNVPPEQKTEKRMIKYHLVSAREHTARSEYQDAVGHCMKALKTAQELKDDMILAGTLRWLGHIHFRKGDFHLALEYLNEGIEKARKIKDRTLEAIFQIELGNVTGSLGDFEQAGDRFNEAIKILEPMGEEDQLSRAYNNLADTLMTRGQFETAASMFRRIKEMFKENPVSRGWAAFNRAECLTEMGRLVEAEDEMREALPLMEKAGDDLGKAIALYIQGLLFAKKGQWDKAAEAIDGSMKMVTAMDLPVVKGIVIKMQGRMFMLKGDKAKAMECFDQAKAIFKEHGAAGELLRLKRDMGHLA